MTVLRHTLGIFVLILGAAIGHLSKWLVQAGAWLIDRENLFHEMDDKIVASMKEVAEKHPEYYDQNK